MNFPPDRNGKLTERRKHRRFRLRKGAYAAINNGSLKIGQIQNISKSGLAFRYVANGEQTEESYKVDIFVADNDFYLTNIPFKTTSDVFIDFEIPFSTISLKQCGGQFGELTKRQMSQIGYFIESYTISEV